MRTLPLGARAPLLEKVLVMVAEDVRGRWQWENSLALARKAEAEARKAEAEAADVNRGTGRKHRRCHEAPQNWRAKLTRLQTDEGAQCQSICISMRQTVQQLWERASIRAASIDARRHGGTGSGIGVESTSVDNSFPFVCGDFATIN